MNILVDLLALVVLLAGALVWVIRGLYKSELELETYRMQLRIRVDNHDKDGILIEDLKKKLKTSEEKQQVHIMDAKQRLEELRSVPIISCMTDAQVLELGKMLGDIIGVELRTIFMPAKPKEIIN